MLTSATTMSSGCHHSLTEAPVLTTSTSLLKTGQFSDFSIKCGDRTFKVHKAILCPQSEYFLKLCNGGFKETTTATATLDEDPFDIEMYLLFCYVGFTKAHLQRLLLANITPTADGTQHERGGAECAKLSQIMRNYAKLWVLGDKYLVPKLKAATAEMYTSQDASLQAVPKTWGESQVEDFLDLVRVIYKGSPPNDNALKVTAVKLAVTVPGICNNKKMYKRLVRAQPDFAWAMLNKPAPEPEKDVGKGGQKRKRATVA